jgi:hypothetical protein
MNGWMDGWLNSWIVVEWVDGLVDGWMQTLLTPPDPSLIVAVSLLCM